MEPSTIADDAHRRARAERPDVLAARPERTRVAAALVLVLASLAAGCPSDARELQQELSRFGQLFLGVFGLFMAVRTFRRRSRLPRADAKFGRYRRPPKPPR